MSPTLQLVCSSSSRLWTFSPTGFREWGGISNLPTLVLRFGVLGFTMLSGWMLSQRKRVYYIAAGVIAFIGLGHIWACMQVGYASPISDLTNYIRVVQMPITVLCLITFLRQDERSFEAMQLGLTGALPPHPGGGNYQCHHWYGSWNVHRWHRYHRLVSQHQLPKLQSVCPGTHFLGLASCPEKKRNWILFWLTAVLGCFSMYFFATRLAYLGIAVVTAGMAISILLARRSDWKVAVGFLALMVLFAGLMPRSPMMIHLNATSGKQDERQGNINQRAR